MIEIRYRDRRIIDDLAGLSVAEVRQQIRDEFFFNDKAAAKLNGNRVKTSLEAHTYLSNGDELSFADGNVIRTLVVIAGVLLVIALYGTFVYGFVNNTSTLKASSADSNFASVIGSTSTRPVMEVLGSFKGSIGGGDLFNIEPAADFPGNLVATVSLANIDKLLKYYRVMALRIEARDSSNNLVDINSDTYKNDKDYVLLTLSNGSVNLYLQGADNYTIKLKGGYYFSHIHNSSWSSGETSPIIYCDISHR